MAGSMGNSIALVKASMNVLKLDKELMLFPVMSGVVSVLVMASFITPIVLTGGGEIFAGDEAGYLAMSVMFLFYVVNYTVIFFFNAALVGAVHSSPRLI